MTEQKDNMIKDRINIFVLKNQKLAQALYAVTAFCPDNEPLKLKLRDQAITLTTTLNTLKTDESTAYNLSFLNQVIINIHLILNLCDLALAGNVLSVMNISIIKQEYESLLKDAKEQLATNNLLDTTSSLPAFRPIDRPKELKDIKDNKTYRQGGIVSDRQQQIIKSLEGQGWLGIKDIADAVPECSTKTVQRELAALVDSGVLKKQGDRRWSRYILAKAIAK